MRPLRSEVSKDSLIMMGVPKKFCSKTIKDFDTFGKKSLKQIKTFVQDYLNDLDTNVEENNGICFIGSNGVGKSFLSCIILKEMYRHRYSCRRVTFSAYISAYTESWGATKSERDVIVTSPCSSLYLKRSSNIGLAILLSISFPISSSTKYLRLVIFFSYYLM